MRVLFDLTLRWPCPTSTPAARTFWLPGVQLVLGENLEPITIPSVLGTMNSAILWGGRSGYAALRHWHAVIPDVFTASASLACDVLLNWAFNPLPEAHPESATPTGDGAKQAEGDGGDDKPPKYVLDLLRVLRKSAWIHPPAGRPRSRHR